MVPHTDLIVRNARGATVGGGLGFVRLSFWCLIAPLLAILYIAWQCRPARPPRSR